LLVIAGAETSRNVISHGLNGLIDEPGQYQELVDDPSLVRGATEEILRWSPAVYYLGRHVTQDTELRGQQLHEGDRVIMMFASGDRDEEKFENPDQLDIHRNPKEHLALGTGPHLCLGNHLARLEIRIAFEELVQQVPQVIRVAPPSYLRSNLAGGVKHLPVDLSAGQR
jgi:cytochrome P450